MSQHLFIGVDGGATKCLVRVEDADRRLLGRVRCVPANIRISVEQAWQSIHQGLAQILSDADISLSDPNYRFHAGMGLAGCECLSAYQAFLAHPHPFHTLKLTSDAYIACLGAHGGNDGAIIVVGTGAVGWQIQQDVNTQVGGYGFPQDDNGSGAWLGLHAMQLLLKAHDGRAQPSPLTKALFAYFQNDFNQVIQWANSANSTAFAQLAPLVITQSEQGDETARRLLWAAAAEIEMIWMALKAKQQPGNVMRCVLVGGIAKFLQPYIQGDLREHLTSCQAPPDEGAVMWIRKGYPFFKERD